MSTQDIEELEALQDFINLLGVSELTDAEWSRFIYLLRLKNEEN